MLTMSLTGAFMEALITSRMSVSVVAGLVTFYFVTTGLLTVRTGVHKPRWINSAATVFGLTIGILALKAGFEMVKSGRPEAVPSLIFGVMALLGAAGDVRMLRARGIQGPRRIARHLWRMCFAMWIAAASFFWGPPRRVPEALRIPALLAVAVLVPIGVMVYWLWRIRVRHTFRGIVGLSAGRAGPADEQPSRRTALEHGVDVLRPRS